MYAPAASARLPARILHLARRDPSVRTDTAVLRALGIRITSVVDGKDALALLEQDRLSETGVLAGGEGPADMPLLSFLQALAARPSLRCTPIVVLAASESAARDLRKAGVQTLTRPYAAADMARVWSMALSPLRRPLDKTALEATARTSPNAGESRSPARTPESRPLLGPENRPLLRPKDRPPPAPGNRSPLTSEGRPPLALQDPQPRAGEDARRKEDYPDIRPGLARLEADDAKAAARFFLDLCQTLPGARLHTVLARACQLTEKPEDNLRRLCAAFESLGRGETAGKLRRRLLRQADPPREEDAPSWLDRFPRIKEVAGVASFTVQAWRLAG
ncbi:MAG: hypothetical protein LBP61_09285 [Desulfovibrio sp.]|jgi:hypothetical protein|nr:hypothetical protein [Desulfovibrio sp.]